MKNVIYRDATMVTDTGTTGVLDTAADNCVADVSELDRISVYVNQLTDAGTCTILVQKSVDGTNFATVATLAETDFPAGANRSKEVTLSDANGMPLRAKQIKVTLSAVSGGGVYSATVAGQM